MDVVRSGRGVRALRMRKKWRQADLARTAGVSQTLIARIERGLGDTVPARKLERVAGALGARVDLRLNYNGEALDRLLDEAHAALVEVVARILRLAGWEVVVEATFWIRGERGSIDILAFHAATGIVLVIEVKSVVPDVQSMLAALDRKSMLASEIARERGWSAIAVATVLVVSDDRTARRRVDAHASTFEQTFPARSVEVRRWILSPDPARPIRGIWFLSGSHRATTRHRVGRPRAGSRAQVAHGVRSNCVR